MFDEDAPKTVDNFRKLSGDGFDEARRSTGSSATADPRAAPRRAPAPGGPGYDFEDEFNQHKVVRGALAMANRGLNTNGSQFFIVTTEAAPWLDGKHTVLAR